MTKQSLTTRCRCCRGHVLIQCSRSRRRPSSAASDLKTAEAGEGKGEEGEEEEEEGEAHDEPLVLGATLAAMYVCRHHGLEPEEAAAWVQLCCGHPRLAANRSDCSNSHSVQLGSISVDNAALTIFCRGVEYSPNNTPLIGEAGLERLAYACSKKESTRRGPEFSPLCSAGRNIFFRTDKSPPSFSLGARSSSGLRSGISADGSVDSAWSAYSASETVVDTREKAEGEVREAPSLETHKFEHLLKFRLENKMDASWSESSSPKNRKGSSVSGDSSRDLRKSMALKAMMNSCVAQPKSFDFHFIQRASSNWESLYDEEDDFHLSDGIKLSRMGSLVGIGCNNQFECRHVG